MITPCSTRHASARVRVSRACALFAWAALAIAACGGGNDDGADSGPAKYLGTWTATAGTAKVTCPSLGMALPNDDVTGEKLTITAGTDAPLEIEFSGCKVKFDVAGNLATARPGQTCNTTYNTSVGAIAAALTVASATLSLTEPTITFNQTGNATVTLNFPLLPPTAACTYELNATAAR